MGKQTSEATDGSQTLERGLTVLTELGRNHGGLTTSEAAVACDLHRSVTHRLLVSLQRTGYATRDAEGRYFLGPSAIGLSERQGPELKEAAEPVLRRLSREIDATASLVEIVGDDALTTVVAEPPTDGPRFSYRLGSRNPADRGAGGIAALASGPELPGEPERVAQARATGYVTTHAELNPGAYGIAAPITGWGIRAAVNVVTAQASLMTEAVEPLLRAAAELCKPAEDA